MRYLLLFALVAFCAVPSLAQVCGGSIRTVSLTSNGEPLTESDVKWELFYARPADTADIDHEALAAFVSKLAGDPVPRNGTFWFRDVIEIPDYSARNYLENYDATAFKPIAERFRHERKDFAGTTRTGSIEFKTGEMDNTPFLLKLTAKGFSDRFVVSAFLGGCYRDGNRNDGGTIELTRQ